jgi:hypothetical protein
MEHKVQIRGFLRNLAETEANTVKGHFVFAFFDAIRAEDIEIVEAGQGEEHSADYPLTFAFRPECC